MATLLQAVFCVALVVHGAKTQRAEIDEEATTTTLATTTKSPVTGNTLIPAVQNATSTTKTSEEETSLSRSTTATSRHSSLLTTSQSSVSTTTFSLLAESSILESTTNLPSSAADGQQTSRPTPTPVTSRPVLVVNPNQRHPNAVSTGNNYEGKNDFSNLVNTAGFRKHVYNQMYQRLQQQQVQYLQSLLFSGLYFDI